MSIEDSLKTKQVSVGEELGITTVDQLLNLSLADLNSLRDPKAAFIDPNNTCDIYRQGILEIMRRQGITAVEVMQKWLTEPRSEHFSREVRAFQIIMQQSPGNQS